MKAEMEKSPAINPNPVLSIAKDGTVLYSNWAAKPLLIEWGVEVGEKLPSSIGDIVQRVISQNSPEKTEVKVGKRAYLVVFHPLLEQKCVSISGFDISDQKEQERKLLDGKALEISSAELAEIIDIHFFKSLMKDFHKLFNISTGLIDLKGNVLIKVGWQDICTKFHRVHPEAFKQCIESDTKLSSDVLPGEIKPCRCKNNILHIATPIMVGSQHVGYVFGGQFFFDDEPLDYELFRSQARKYGFNEEEYIAALEKVPRLSSETVETSMSFFMTLANLISQLSYSNITLAQSLAKRDELVNTLLESEKRERARLDELAVVLDAVPAAMWITHDPWALHLTGNRLSYEWLRLPGGANMSKAAPEGKRPETYRMFKDGVELPLEDMPVRMSASGKEVRDYEFDLVYPDGKVRHLLGNVKPLIDENDNPQGAVSAFIDITERKRAEEEVQSTRNMLQLIMDNIPQGIFWKDRNSRYLGCNKVFAKAAGLESPENIVGKTDYDLPWSPEQTEWFREYDLRIMKNGAPEYHIVESQREADGELAWVETNKVPLHDAKGNVIGILGTYEDITERKRAEEALKKTNETLEEKVKERTLELEEAYKSVAESERSLAEAQEMVHIGNWERDFAIDKLHWSDEMYRIFGLKPKEFEVNYGLFLNYVHPDDRCYIDNAFKESLNGKPINIDFRITLANEEERIAHAKGEVVFDDNNNPIRIRGTAQDITELKEAEKKIHHLANVVESSGDAIGTLSLDGTVTSWNKGAEQIYGYSVQEILGKHISFPAPNNLKGETQGYIELIKQTGMSYKYTSSRIRKDGQIIDVSINLSPVFDNYRKLTAISFISRDITEQKRYEEKLRESEDKYRNIVETANEGIIITDNKNRITYVNKKFADMLRYTIEEVNGSSIWSFISKEYKSVVKKNLKQRKKGKNGNYEFKLIRKDGSPMWILLNAKLLFDEEGKYVGAISMLTDITERKEAEEALAKIEIARQKEIHHRIKNNLQVISSLLDLQAEKFIEKRCIRESEVLEAFKESQNRVISMALIHEELHKGGGFEKLNFSSYIKGLADNLLLTYRLGNKNISLDMSIEDAIYFDVDTAVPLGIVVNEIVSNSLKHAYPDRKDGEIQIVLRREEGSDSSFVLTISDNGVGIPENLDIENLNSLGLQLVTSLVDQLDGKLELKRNNGAEFTIRFAVPESKNPESARSLLQLANND